MAASVADHKAAKRSSGPAAPELEGYYKPYALKTVLLKILIETMFDLMLKLYDEAIPMSRIKSMFYRLDFLINHLSL